MDFRLKVFYSVATRLSFTKASSELFITQPAVSKHIRELEDEYGVKLFERAGNTILLTQAGELLLEYAKDVFEVYRKIEHGMGALINIQQGVLRLGASTTISQYIIPPVLAGFKKKYVESKVNLITGNTEQVENALLNKDIEVGIVEGQSKNPAIKYTQFLKDELVLVCNATNVLAQTELISSNELRSLRFIFREQGSGTLEVIEHALRSVGIKPGQLATEMHLGSTEGIKSYLMNSDCVAFLSIHAIQKELVNNQLRVIDIKDLSIGRYLSIINLQGKTEGLSESFIKYISGYTFW